MHKVEIALSENREDSRFETRTHFQETDTLTYNRSQVMLNQVHYDISQEALKIFRRPEWLKVKSPGGESYSNIRTMMRSKQLHTVCEEARCPNIGECWHNGTATFLILGDICTRSCKFCAVKTGKPNVYDLDEPLRVAESVRKMNLKHTVITSVNRDELKDQGSLVWANTIREIRNLNPNTTIEVLIPDFKGDLEILQVVLDAKPDILNHNVETIPRLYRTVRPQAKFERSLKVLKYSKEQGLRTKTGFMVGLGETFDEVIDLMKEIINVNVEILTIGQYLQPSKEHLQVERFVNPEEFDEYKRIGLSFGFKHIESGPLVRSSYHAERHI